MRHANIALFVPHLGCPQQCSFCDQNAITGQNGAPLPTPQDVLDAAALAAGSLGPDRSRAEIAFFGGSFTAIDRGTMLALLDAAKQAADRYGFGGVRCSTRPDAVDEEVLALLKERRVTAVELGAQSMDDGVLAANRRGHTAAQTRRAAGLIRQMGFELGLQMMTGLLGDTEEKSLSTARELIALGPKTARVYPTLVLPRTRLAQLYADREYAPQTLDQAVDLCARLLALFQGAGVRVIRMGLHPGPELERRVVAGPYHPAFRQLVESRGFLGRLAAALPGPGRFAVRVNPRDISTALGQGRQNLAELARRGYFVRLTQDGAVARGDFDWEEEHGA